MSLPEAELVKLPGFSKDINKSREEAKKLLEEAGVKDLKFKLLNRNVAEPYTPGAVYSIDQWRRIGVIGRARAARDQALPGSRGRGRLRRRHRVPGRLHGRSDGAVLQVPDQEGRRPAATRATPTPRSTRCTRSSAAPSMWPSAPRSCATWSATRSTQAYNVPLLWWQRIIVNHKKIQGWYMTPSHYLWQDLTTVWLD